MSGHDSIDALVASARRGDAQAQRDLGCAFWWGEPDLPKDDQQSRHWYSLAAAQNHCEALYDLATMLLNGEGGPADVPGALACMRRAASRRRWEPAAESAASLLAQIYREGHFGVAPDAAQAEHWERTERDIQRKYCGWRRRRSSSR